MPEPVGNTGSRVTHFDDDGVRLVLHVKADLPARWCVFDGVVDEVDQRLPKHEAIAAAVAVRLAVGDQGLVLFLSQDRQVVDDALRDLAQVDGFGGNRDRLCCVLCAKALEQKERSWHKVACRSRPTHKGVTP